MARKSQKKDKTKPNTNKESSQINKHPCFCNCSIVNWLYIPLIIYHLYIANWVSFFGTDPTYETGKLQRWPLRSWKCRRRLAPSCFGTTTQGVRRSTVDGTRETWNHREALEGFLSPRSNWGIIISFDNGRPVRITKSSKIILMRLKKGV